MQGVISGKGYYYHCIDFGDCIPEPEEESKRWEDNHEPKSFEHIGNGILISEFKDSKFIKYILTLDQSNKYDRFKKVPKTI